MIPLLQLRQRMAPAPVTSLYDSYGRTNVLNDKRYGTGSSYTPYSGGGQYGGLPHPPDPLAPVMPSTQPVAAAPQPGLTQPNYAMTPFNGVSGQGMPTGGGLIGSASQPVQSGPGNAAQRWSGSSDPEQMAPLSPQRRMFWATGRIDARARQSPQNSRSSFTPQGEWAGQFKRQIQMPAPVSRPSGWDPY